MSYATPITAANLTSGHPIEATRLADLAVHIDRDPEDSLAGRATWLLANISHPAVALGVVQTAEELAAFEADAAKIRSLPGYRWVEEDSRTALLRIMGAPS